MAPFFSDTFTEASVDTTLASHAPDVGTSWTRIYNDGSGPSFNVIAATDHCKMVSGNNSGMVYTADVTYPSADYDVVFTIVGGPTTNADRPLYVFVRLQDIENMYAVKIMYTGTLSQLYTKVSGTWTAVGSAFTAPATGSVCKLEIIGTALKFYDDGAEVASATVTDISAAGKAGLGGGGGSELVLSTDDCNSTWEIDALSVTDLGAGGTDPEGSLLGGKLLRGGLLLHGVLGR